MEVLKIKKLNEDAIIPFYAHPGDAGLDLFSVEEVTIEPGKRQLVATGISIELPKNTEAQVRPRSGLALKYGVTVLNSPGTIDEGYRGEIKVILINHGEEAFKINRGDKIAQMVIMPVLTVGIEEVEILNDSERGEGGFGSTGRK
ncbi:dUTP diphosphatase [Clostridium bornimense]|uniref:dUTP diphosphatase n=1 Tax=Clostridium bornimense TaxID=1216932 RepID=UPI001C1258C3|nr:dUTP diphosphatase [Clostridium bornimense]MBU5315907.1 dUTP diphosphatase [Clostridium bornimense]